MNGLTIWRKGWKKKNALKINCNLRIQIDAHLSRLDISFVWVRGHNGNLGNEKADELAMIGRNRIAKRSGAIGNVSI